jgi:chaperone protein EcpD
MVACTWGPVSTSASVIIGGTRVIYPGGVREVTVKLNNVGNDPSLVQVWGDRGDASVSADEADVPFVIVPPIFRIDPANAQALRITYTQEPLPQDRESVFWLNVLDVPPSPAPSAPGTSEVNLMQVAIRSRIKIFFRPENLPGDPVQAAENLTWRVVPAARGPGYALRGENPSAYAVSFNRVGLAVGDKEFTGDGGMILPRGTTDFPLRDLLAVPSGAVRVNYQWINDYGASEDRDVPLESPEKATQGDRPDAQARGR